MSLYFNSYPKKVLGSSFGLGFWSRRHIFLKICLITLFYLFCSSHNLAQASSLIDYFRTSIKLNIAEKEEAYLAELQELNNQIKQELAQGKRITDVLNHIEQGGLEKDVLTSFFGIINLRKEHNDQIDKKIRQKGYKDNSEKRQIQKTYQLLKVNLVSDNMKKFVYLYPIIMPFAGYVQPGIIKITDINKRWFQNEDNFKFCFLYLYRKFANLNETIKNYSLLSKKVTVSVENGSLRLEKFFNHDMGFEFFDQKFDTGILNNQSKFFGFDGYIYKYLRNEHQTNNRQTSLIKVFKTYSAYKAYCKDCDLLKFYNERKFGMFKDLILEMEHALEYNANTLDNYMKPLYYLSRTFPNLSAFILTRTDKKYKFTTHEEKSPVLESLKAVWNKIEAKEKDPNKAVRMLKYTLGSIYLLPQKEIFLADEEYDFDRSGYATYMQEYIAIYNKYQPSQ